MRIGAWALNSMHQILCHQRYAIALRTIAARLDKM